MLITWRIRLRLFSKPLIDKRKPAWRARRHSSARSSTAIVQYKPVDLDLAVCPVVQRPPGANVAVFHLVKNFLDHELAPIRPNDLDIAPFLVTSNQQGFAQISIP